MDAGGKKQRLGCFGPCLDLSTAACELRAATTVAKLESHTAEEEWNYVEAFYGRLNNLQKTYEVNSPWYKPIIVSVECIAARHEGESFVRDLGEMYSGSIHVAGNPPASLSTVKGIFDQIGGAAATAFDVVSTYMAVQECKDACMAERQPLVFIIANFCSSAVCCVGSDDVLVWPTGLLKPRLNVTCVQDTASPELAKVCKASQKLDVEQICKALQKLDVEQISLRVDGLSEEQLLNAAKDGIDKALFPSTADLEVLGADPLRCLVNVARKEGLLGDIAHDKKWQLGRRGKHIPWSFQLATSNRSAAAPPSLRNLGIHSVTETGFIFFSLGSAGGATGEAGEEVLASMVLLLGSYPFQQQWRGEGVVRKMRWGSPPPPFSLACAMQRCKEIAETTQQTQHEGTHGTHGAKQRAALSDQEAVLGTRADDTRDGPSTAYIFIPHRMEVLIGHPPAPGGTRRCEWQRSSSRLWEGPRAVLPFSPQHLEVSWEQSRARKATVVLMGTHTAGKSTIRKILAERMQWVSDEELGTSLRGDQEKQGKYREAWDDTIHQAEVDRDRDRMSTLTSRVVETWHLGNFVWALTRRPQQHGDLLKRAVDAVRQEREGGTVLLVLLKIDAATMVRRRAKFQTSTLPFQDEEADAGKLSKATGEKLEELLEFQSEELEGLKMPILKLDNSQDGDTALNDTVDAIVDFITFFV